MDHKNSDNVDHTDKHFVNAYRRTVEKKAPAHKKRSDADCLILETLVDYLSQKNDKERAFFITYNTDDFGYPQNKDELHPDLIPTFDAVDLKYHSHLAKVLKDEFNQEIGDEDIEFETTLVDLLQRDITTAGYISFDTFLSHQGFYDFRNADEAATFAGLKSFEGAPIPLDREGEALY